MLLIKLSKHIKANLYKSHLKFSIEKSDGRKAGIVSQIIDQNIGRPFSVNQPGLFHLVLFCLTNQLSQISNVLYRCSLKSFQTLEMRLKTCTKKHIFYFWSSKHIIASVYHSTCFFIFFFKESIAFFFLKKIHSFSLGNFEGILLLNGQNWIGNMIIPGDSLDLEHCKVTKSVWRRERYSRNIWQK